MSVPEEASLAAHGWIFSLIVWGVIAGMPLSAAAHPTAKVRTVVSPYLMPEDHPIKPQLDALFRRSRAIFNLRTLEAAGFNKSKPRKFTKLIVTSHVQFPGYIFKLYLDTQRYYKESYEHEQWIMRVQGVEKVRAQIAARGLEWAFKAPKKWIYALPSTPEPSSDFPSKHYILVEEDMELFSDEENAAIWASNDVSPALLDGLFQLLQAVGLDDCLKPDNLPFSKDGRVAFIDTQSTGQTVHYKRLLPFLSPDNQRYWKSIIH